MNIKYRNAGWLLYVDTYVLASAAQPAFTSFSHTLKTGVMRCKPGGRTLHAPATSACSLFGDADAWVMTWSNALTQGLGNSSAPRGCITAAAQPR